MNRLASAAFTSLALLWLGFANACASKDAGTTGSAAGSSAGGSGVIPGGGTPAAGGVNQAAGSGTTAGSGGTGPITQGGAVTGGTGSGTGGSGTGGTAQPTSGAGGVASGGTGSGGYAGFEAGDTLPWRPLNVMAAASEHQHGDAGMDGRAKPLGKLVVDIGVNSGSYQSWLAKRGYHSIGAPCGACAAPNLGGSRDTVGDCRLNTEWANTAAKVKSMLDSLSTQYPEEDWGYFLNKDGSVRWSDVAITGMSHGATTAAVAGRLGARMWRVVSRAGPRDDTCGNNGGVCTMPITTPSYDANCMPADIASWLDKPSLTPIDRFYGIDGITDVECGDIMFDMHYAQYPGVPVLFDVPGAVLTGTNQFFSTTGGHLDFLGAANKPMNTEAVLNIAFAIPPDNQNPTF